MSTIPANELVNVVPSVLAAGGSGVDIIGLCLTPSARVPVGTVLSFPDGASVQSYFGAASAEDIIANGGSGLGSGYFAGFDNSPKKPSSLLFAQYNPTAVAAYLRGGNISSLTLAQIQALSGSLTVTVNGVALAAPSVNLSASTSFSSAAGIIQAALAAAAPSAASVTGSIGGQVTGSAGATFTGSGSGTNLTASSVTGVIHVGAAVTGTGVPAGTYIVSQTSGSAGAAGVYVTNNVTTSSSASLTASSNTLDVTAVVGGTLQPGAAISGTGIAANTTVLAQTSGAPGGIGLYTLSSQQQFASATITALSTVLNVTAVGSGAILVGSLLAGTNVSSGTIVTGQLTGSGGTGTYTVSLASTTVSETITAAAVTPTVTYDSTSGAFTVASGSTGATSTISFGSGTLAAPVKLTSATGAILSQGAAAAATASATAGFMNALIIVNSNWVTFFTAVDPDSGSGNTIKQALAAWKNSQNNRFAYICEDTDITPTESVPATSSLGYILAQNNDSGSALIYEPTALNQAAFISGAAASIDFTAKNGRTTFAYRSQAGLVAGVTDPTVAQNLGGDPQTPSSYGNGYNFYGAYGAANANSIWYQRGLVTGPFRWLDSYINQIWLNNAFQTALLNLLGSASSVPYTTQGRGLIESALNDPIQAGLNFGAFAPGTLTSAQRAIVNGMAGSNISPTLEANGYYLQILPAAPATRAARTTPPAKFWYIDGGSVQSISLSSIALT